MDTAELADLFAGFDLSELWQHVLPLLRPALKVKLENHAPTAVGDSRIGGIPDLPQSIEWPHAQSKPLAFIAQINLAEVRQAGGDKIAAELPAYGWLYFFYDAVNEHWGDVPDDYWHFAVRFFDGDAAELAPRDAPPLLASENRFVGSAVSFAPQMTFPDESSATWPSKRELTLTRKQWMALGDLEGHVYEMNNGRYNQLLGHSTNLQEGMEPLCSQMARQFFDDDGTENDWVLLLQLDSNDTECGMMWGDCGVLYFWIRRQDLQRRRFERCWCVMQCF